MLKVKSSTSAGTQINSNRVKVKILTLQVMPIHVYSKCDDFVLQIFIVPEDWPYLAIKQAVVL